MLTKRKKEKDFHLQRKLSRISLKDVTPYRFKRKSISKCKMDVNTILHKAVAMLKPENTTKTIVDDMEDKEV